MAALLRSTVSCVAFLRLLAAAALGCCAIGCGDDGDGGSTDGSVDECAIGGKVSGGVEHVFGGVNYACSGTDSTTTVAQLLGKGAEAFTGGSIGLSFLLNPAPTLGQTGPLAMSSVEINETGPEPADATAARERFAWKFADGACVLNVTSSVLDPEFDWLWFGTDVSCTEAAVAEAPNTKAPVTMTGLSFNSFVSLPE